MPDPPVDPPDPCPECKIIINGRRISNNAGVIADVVEKMMDRGQKLPPAFANIIINRLNEAEDLVDAATEKLARGQGYSGPLNKALDFKS